jgi:hypothetical protein
MTLQERIYDADFCMTVVELLYLEMLELFSFLHTEDNESKKEPANQQLFSKKMGPHPISFVRFNVP